MTPEAGPIPPPPVLDDVRHPFWGYGDVGMLVLLSVPSLFVAFYAVHGVRLVMRSLFPGGPFELTLAQLVWYILIFGLLGVLFRVKYNAPFWKSLGWRFPFRGMLPALIAGPLLAFGLGLLGALLRTPHIPLPFDQMLRDRPNTILFAIFAVIVGPLSEELAFRGFLMPLLIRPLTPFAGIVLTGVLFGSLHAKEYLFTWQYVVIVSLAGIVFGWVRYRTGSTAASTVVHATFNLTQLAGFLAR